MQARMFSYKETLISYIRAVKTTVVEGSVFNTCAPSFQDLYAWPPFLPFPRLPLADKRELRV